MTETCQDCHKPIRREGQKGNWFCKCRREAPDEIRRANIALGWGSQRRFDR